MYNNNLIVLCPRCGAKNRIPENRTAGNAVCGKCKTQLNLTVLFPNRPLNATDSSFHDEVIRFNSPVLVDFKAPW
jgi:thioredoxin 2